MRTTNGKTTIGKTIIQAVAIMSMLCACGKKSASPSETGIDPVVFTSLHFRQRTLSENNSNSRWRPVREWTPVSSRIQESMMIRNAHPLSPMDEIRILIVLDKSWLNKSPIPVKIQSVLLAKRNDEKTGEHLGPVYETTTKILGEEDFLETDFSSAADREKFIGAPGVVFYPSFKIGRHTFRGTKPIGDSKPTVGEVWAAYNRDHLLAYYSYRYSIESDPAGSRLLSIGWDGNKQSAIDAYPVDIQEKRLHVLRIGKNRAKVYRRIEYYFIDEDVLFTPKMEIPYTQLLDKIGTSWVFYRVQNKSKGMKNFVTAHNGFLKQISEENIHLRELDMRIKAAADNGALYVENYREDQPVEVVVFFNAGEQSIYKYTQAGLNYRELPIQATLYNYASDADQGKSNSVLVGPTLHSVLVNFGEKMFYKGRVKYRKEDRTRRFIYKRDIDRLLEKYPFLVPEKPGSKIRHYYGARFVLDFEKINQEMAEKKQAFVQDKNGFYRFYLSFNTGGIGFNQTMDRFPIFLKFRRK